MKRRANDANDGTNERRRTVALALVVGVVALVVRLGVALWARDFPVTADGFYYHTFAARLASGAGYTWLWPDGAVTYAAHYPVGYPALLAPAYAVFGARPFVAMVVNAVIGALGSVAVFDLLAARARDREEEGVRSPGFAVAGGLVSAIHPVLVPYTAAVMTEGITASLLVIGAACTARARSHAAFPEASGALGRTWRFVLVTGLVLGVATLVRPQSLALAPVFGWLALSGGPAYGRLRRAALGLAAVTALALLVCAPWTYRNCTRMKRCALVSVNGGWNLAIGTQTIDGGWREMQVPEPCKTVWDEAAKDACFGREAVKTVEQDVIGWARRAPAKLRMTFDYFGAAPWYLHAASAERFPYRSKVALGAVETIASRLVLVLALVSLLRVPISTVSLGGRRLAQARLAIVALGIAAGLASPSLGYLACAVAILAMLRDARVRRELPLVVPASAAVILATMLTHAVFFGSGRYGIVIVPFVTALAFVRVGRHVKRVDAEQAIAGEALHGTPREESPSSNECDAG